MANNSEILQKLKDHLKELFQFDSSDLDFGIYRIMNYKRKEIENFIEQDLIKAVENEFNKYKLQSNKELTEKIQKVENKIKEDFGSDILHNGKLVEKYGETKIVKEYLELKKQIEEIEITESIQARVFNDLYNFFSRYYEDGDFISKKRYSGKQHKYAIPYNGEEVKLYWANYDQYYVKTGEIFKDYEFNQKGYRFIFRTSIVDVPAGNIKGDRRYFVLHENNPVQTENKICIINFEYRPLTDTDFKKYPVKTKGEKTKETGIKQDELNPILKDKILAAIKSIELKAILSETQDDKTILEKHLFKFTRKITSDFFIHKDLKGFLERELDYFIKTEVLDIESFDNEKERYFDKHLTRTKVVRNIGKRIIEFLAQIEDFQKYLWEKKKFVLKTEYVISLKTLKNIIDENIYNEIKSAIISGVFKNNIFKEDLKNSIKECYKQPGFNIYVENVNFGKELINLIYVKRFTEEAKFKEYIQNNKKLKYYKRKDVIKGAIKECYFVEYDSKNIIKELSYDDIYVDTKYFSQGFKEKLLQGLSEKINIDDLANGVVIKSENFQGLNLLIEKYREKVKCIYIDPPYNTGSDEFIYKDNYQHSSWISMIQNRLFLARNFLHEKGSFYCSIDWNESHLLKVLLDLVFGKENFQREIIWNTGENISGFKSIAPNWIRQHDTIYFYSKHPNKLVFNKLWKPINSDGSFNWVDIIGDNKENLYIEKWGKGKLAKIILDIKEVKPIGDVWNDILSFQYSEPRVTESWFFDTQKVENLLRRIIQSSTQVDDYVLDFFLGSGTTSGVAHKLGRKYIGIEIGNCFEEKILVRLKTILLGDLKTHLSKEVNWQGGGFFKYHYLEQYEDTLHNIDFPQEEKAKTLFDKLSDEGKTEYLMKYMLKFETEGSPSLLDIKQFEDPFKYKLKIISSGKGEEIVNVDLVETFNYLIGLKINKYKFLQENSRKYVFIFGERNNRKTAIVWRSTKDIDLVKDKEVIDSIVSGYAPEEIFVNGDSYIKGYKVIENEFKALMGV